MTCLDKVQAHGQTFKTWLIKVCRQGGGLHRTTNSRAMSPPLTGRTFRVRHQTTQARLIWVHLSYTDCRVPASKSHSSPPCSYPCPWASWAPSILALLTVPALFPSARLIFSGILRAIFSSFQPSAGGKEKRNGVAGNGGRRRAGRLCITGKQP